MDSFKSALGLGDQKPVDATNQAGQPAKQNEGGGFLGGIGNKLNAAAGGGPESEKNEDLLDKGIQYFIIEFRSFDQCWTHRSYK